MAAYSSGSATSFADVLAALETILTANGWSAAAATGGGRIFSKGAAFIRFRAAATTLLMLGGTGNDGGALVNPSPAEVGIKSLAPVLIVFPITFEIHLNEAPDEVYIVLSYGGNKYQHMHFGVSDIPDIGGTGLWIAGSMRAETSTSHVYSNVSRQAYGTQQGGISHGYFMSNSVNQSSPFIHCGLEGAAAWRQDQDGSGTVAGRLRGQHHLAGLIQALPSRFNGSEVLLPIYALMGRTDNTTTIVATMRNARAMRVDNVTPGDVIIYGTDQWKVYPLYSKSVTDRNGVPWNVGADHSGTFGVAIRYHGG